MINITKVHDGKFKLINAHDVTPNDFITLSQDYGITNEMLHYTQSRAEIPRFIEGQDQQQKLFLVDIPARDKDMGTVPLSVVINDNTSLVVFTNEQTQYVIPIMSKCLNEKGSSSYTTVCLCLDVLNILANKYLDRIKDIDKARIKNRNLLRDKTKKRDREYIDHLNDLLVTSSAYTDSLSSDKELLLSVREVLSSYINKTQRWYLGTDIVIFKQAQREAEFSQRRIRLVIHSFRMKISMNTSHKLNTLTVLESSTLPSSLLFSYLGMNLGSSANGLPLTTNGEVITTCVVLTVAFLLFYRFYLNRMK